MYRYVYGDKDLFEMAFMLAGDQHTFNQVKVNPRLALEDSQVGLCEHHDNMLLHLHREAHELLWLSSNRTKLLLIEHCLA